MKRSFSRILLLLTLAVLLFTTIRVPVQADPLDEIENYEINAVVNEDATVTLTYHIDWRVLDSGSEGPLSWVRVGIPNSHYSEAQGLTDNIKSIKYDSSGGSYMRIDFDREYFAGEVVTFEFSVVQDYLYQVNKLEEGYTVYSFTPGWFDDIAVDKLTLRWKADKAESWTPDCLVLVGNLVWMQHDMKPRDTLTVSVTYPNDAYGFDLSKKIEVGNSNEYDWICGLIGVFLFMGGPIAIIVVIVKAISKNLYRGGAAFGNGKRSPGPRSSITIPVPVAVP